MNDVEIKNAYKQFLINQGYSLKTPSGHNSTVYDYQKRIDYVCEIENFDWEKLAENIDSILLEYSPDGIKAELGAKSHGAVISALKQYKIFLNQKDVANVIQEEKRTKEIRRVKENKKIIEEIENPENKETEKQALIKIRLGHSKLRERVLESKKECDICGLNHPKLLVASHIKVWAQSDNEEKLDEENILLLCSMHDALFDKGLISFDDNGKILISSSFSENNQALSNVNEDSSINIVSEKQKEYLKWHRENIFIK